MPTRIRRKLCAALVLLIASGRPASAQIMASERATVSQNVDGTRITLDYSRPRARGRTNIYGGMEKWGTTWTPGADDATTLEVSKPVRLLGMMVPKGKYSVWLVLREKDAWTFVLDPRDTLFHTDHPDSTAQQLRAPVTPQTVPQTEVLTWSFPAVTTSGATLDFRWGTMGVSVPIVVEPTYPLVVRAADVAPYLGVYDFRWTDPRNEEKASTFTVRLRGDALVGEWDPPQFKTMRSMQLLTAGPDLFVNGFMRDGTLWAVNPGSKVRFVRANGRVTGFRFENGADTSATGTRRP